MREVLFSSVPVPLIRVITAIDESRQMVAHDLCADSPFWVGALLEPRHVLVQVVPGFRPRYFDFRGLWF